MKIILLTLCVLSGTLSFSQTPDRDLAQVMKIDGINVFVKSKPYEHSYLVEEIKVSGFMKSAKEQAKMSGAAGYKHLQYAIQKGKEEMSNVKKHGDGKIAGNVEKFNSIRHIKGSKYELLNVHTGNAGSGKGVSGALARVESEHKTGKLVFYAAKPLAKYEVVSKITYNQGGLGETMRGVTFLDVAINGMLDKGVRWEKKEKIEAFQGLIVDWRAMRAGQVKGELIRFK